MDTDPKEIDNEGNDKLEAKATHNFPDARIPNGGYSARGSSSVEPKAKPPSKSQENRIETEQLHANNTG